MKEDPANSASGADRTATEERIFEAALQVFARTGRAGARMQEIADRAAINKAMLHYYFRSKDRLYAQVFQYVFRRFDQAFFEAVERAGEESFAAALRAFIDHYVDFVGHHTEVLRLMVNEFLAGGEVLRGEMGKLMGTGQAPPQRLLALIQRAIDRGEIRPVEPRHLMVTMVSGCLFPLIALPMVGAMLPEAVTDYEQFLRDRRQHLFDVLWRGLAPEDA
jgi:TetR/AcrR family transcriptional regulator